MRPVDYLLTILGAAMLALFLAGCAAETGGKAVKHEDAQQKEVQGGLHVVGPNGFKYDDNTASASSNTSATATTQTPAAIGFVAKIQQAASEAGTIGGIDIKPLVTPVSLAVKGLVAIVFIVIIGWCLIRKDYSHAVLYGILLIVSLILPWQIDVCLLIGAFVYLFRTHLSPPLSAATPPIQPPSFFQTLLDEIRSMPARMGSMVSGSGPPTPAPPPVIVVNPAQGK